MQTHSRIIGNTYNAGTRTEFQQLENQLLKYRLRQPHISKLIFTVNLFNQNNRFPASNIKLYIPIIQNESAHHFALIDSIVPVTNTFLNDTYRNVYAYWEIETLPRNGLSVTITYYLLSFTATFFARSEKALDYDKSSIIYQRYTQPEELIQSDAEEIVATAKNVIGNDTDPYKKVQKIYSFVKNYLSYEVQDEEKGALWALKNKKGDCSEFSYLFVALCRAVDVPSRVKAGFVFHNPIETLEYGHMWAEYYLENYGWTPVDILWEHFGFLDNLHFACLQSKPELIPYSSYHATYNGTLESSQEVQITLADISSFKNFVFAENFYNAILKIMEAEQTVNVAKLIGSEIFFSSTFKKIEHLLLEADLQQQNAMDFWGIEIENSILSSNHAYIKAQEAINLAQKALVSTIIGISASISLGILLLNFVIIAMKRKKQQC
jgi:hypothetical protein